MNFFCDFCDTSTNKTTSLTLYSIDTESNKTIMVCDHCFIKITEPVICPGNGQCFIGSSTLGIYVLPNASHKFKICDINSFFTGINISSNVCPQTSPALSGMGLTYRSSKDSNSDDYN